MRGKKKFVEGQNLHKSLTFYTISDLLTCVYSIKISLLMQFYQIVALHYLFGLNMIIFFYLFEMDAYTVFVLNIRRCVCNITFSFSKAFFLHFYKKAGMAVVSAHNCMQFYCFIFLPLLNFFCSGMSPYRLTLAHIFFVSFQLK